MQITNNGTLEEAVKYRNSECKKAISQQNNIHWDQTMSKANKRKIYNTIIKSIVAYSSEVWQINSTTEKMFNTTEMDQQKNQGEKG